MTIAHVAIADAARRQCRLDRLDFVLSRQALAKESGHHHALDERAAALQELAAARPWTGVRITDAQLVADIAEGYDVVVMGADKWNQLHDVAFYGGSALRRDEALARLPEVAIAPRPPVEVRLDRPAVLLDLPADLAAVSSSSVRAGRDEWRARAPGSH